MSNRIDKSKDKWIDMPVDKEISQRIDQLLADNPSARQRYGNRDGLIKAAIYEQIVRDKQEIEKLYPGYEGESSERILKKLLHSSL